MCEKVVSGSSCSMSGSSCSMSGSCCSMSENVTIFESDCSMAIESVDDAYLVDSSVSNSLGDGGSVSRSLGDGGSVSKSLKGNGFNMILENSEFTKPSGSLLKDSKVYKSLEPFLKVSEDVKSDNANLTVIPSQSSYEYGSDVRLNFGLYDGKTPLTGLVLVNVDKNQFDVNVTNGSAFLIISGLENNTYQVKAEFVGNDAYNSVINNDAIIVVNKSRLVTGKATVTEEVIYGEDMVVTITDLMDVDGKKLSVYGGYQVVGPINLYGSFFISKGKGSFHVPVLPVGNYSVYVGTGNNVGGNYDLPKFILNFTVVKAKSILSVDVDRINGGEEVIFNVNLKDEANYGVEITDIKNSSPIVEIQFDDYKENVTLDMGEGIINVTGLPEAIYDAVAIFKETDFYEESRYEFSFKVGKEEVVMDYSICMDTLVRSSDDKYDDCLDLTLKDIWGNLLSNKTVLIIYDGNEYNETTNDIGKIILNVSFKNYQQNKILVNFEGDEEYKSLSKNITFVAKRKNMDLTVINKAYKYRTPKKVLTATFKLDNGRAIIGKTINFAVNGLNYSAKTNSKGQATVRVNLTKKGTYNFTAEFMGDADYAPISKSGKIVLK